MSVNKNENWMRTTSIYVGSGLLLLISYFFLYVAMQMMTEIYLEPLHKSFTTRPNVFLPAAVIIGASALLFLVRMVREQDRLRLILIFALNHLFSLVLFTGLAIPMHHLLPRAWAPWPGLVSSATLLLALLLAQGTSWPWRRQPVRHLVWVALGLLLIVLVITFGGIVAAPSEQALTMGLPPSPSTVNPAAPSTPLPVPTAVAPEHPAQETHVRLGAPLHGEPPVRCHTLRQDLHGG